MHIPPRQPLGQHRAFDIEYLLFCQKKAENRECSWSFRSVMGLPLPSWQRPYEWDEVQQQRFIESIYLDLYHGVYVLNAADYEGPDGSPKKFSNALLDGQQRITTIEKYLNDEFEVFGALWSELTKGEQRRFLNSPFHCMEVSIWDEDKLRELSDRLAFGGTAHKDEYRASLGYNYQQEDRK
ncbi:DUF262 domain-containing protein [Vibrio coralliilyticus]|uniref:DUF262 domain-containing protein n=1 Tax=Vibrio coralliilyticus TaxID=190893 RepID=A0AAP7DEJ0_9VIBR|nr:DUF262 domain-containing protein [Vibrio coralliilyticus]NOI32022.1 DUF262 domain-containing protein [Vibrio coralliilyticus]NOJ25223.1 DUF262 domain-containing protein [Vibrio coralliilyticus]